MDENITKKDKNTVQTEYNVFAETITRTLNAQYQQNQKFAETINKLLDANNEMKSSQAAQLQHIQEEFEKFQRDFVVFNEDIKSRMNKLELVQGIQNDDGIDLAAISDAAKVLNDIYRYIASPNNDFNTNFAQAHTEIAQLTQQVNRIDEALKKIEQKPSGSLFDKGKSQKVYKAIVIGIAFICAVSFAAPFLSIRYALQDSVNYISATVERVLWNQSYGGTQLVTPFTPQKEFQQLWHGRQDAENAARQAPPAGQQP